MSDGPVWVQGHYRGGRKGSDGHSWTLAAVLWGIIGIGFLVLWVKSSNTDSPDASRSSGATVNAPAEPPPPVAPLYVPPADTAPPSFVAPSTSGGTYVRGHYRRGRYVRGYTRRRSGR